MSLALEVETAGLGEVGKDTLGVLSLLLSSKELKYAEYQNCNLHLMNLSG